jgi:hypothetical protein
VRWPTVKGGRQLDAKRLAAEHPDVVADYWVERASSRRMTLVGMGEEEAA